MRNRPARWLGGLLALVVSTAAAAAQTPSLRTRMWIAEDARASDDAAIAPLLDGLRSRDPVLVIQAVRGLGRLEQARVAERIVPLLAHVRPEVRGEAANALGQCLAALPRTAGIGASPELSAVTRALRGRLDVELNAEVIAVIAETLGRLPYRTTADIDESAAVLRALLPPSRDDAPDIGSTVSRPRDPRVLAGAAKGLEALARLNPRTWTPDTVTRARVRSLATARDLVGPSGAIARRLAWAAALRMSGSVDVALAARGYEDADMQVRRLAISGVASAAGDETARATLIARAFNDPAFHVRYEAVRAHAQRRPMPSCEPLVSAAADASPHVALAAIDALGGCTDAVATATLLALVDSLVDHAVSWHRPAHALVALARANREQTTTRLARFAEHRQWQVRMYAARAAVVLGASAMLERLASDPSDNVRNEAIQGLRRTVGREADPLLIEALSRADYQLVRTAAQLLEGSPRTADASRALLRAFARISAERRETSRDPRLAILTRVRELGTRADAPALQPCLADFDRVVANECAALLTAWTGTTVTARPVPLERPAAPAALPTSARIEMTGGRVIVLRLFSEDAPATVDRVAQLARRGYYDGLLIHRVAPNFVIQGGGPGANEYSGDGRYLRDELGRRTHARGTVGISTRGRDTGDAQLFVNLLDNPRLDHEYTVLAEVVSGMDVIDTLLEGDAIVRVRVR